VKGRGVMNFIRSFCSAVYPYLPPVLKDLACSYEGYRLHRLRFGRQYGPTLDWLKKTQWWSAEQQRSYQLEMLRETLEIAETNVPYYRELFRNIGFCSKDLKSLDDLENLPVLKKSDIKNNPKAFVSVGEQASELVENHTSGTTGTRLDLVTTRTCVQKYFAVAWRQRGWFDVDNGMAHATFNGRTIVPLEQKHPPFWCHNKPGKQTLFSFYHIKPSNLKAYVEELSRFPRQYITGYPSILHLFSNLLLENRIELPWRPKAIFTSSETLLENQRSAIARAFRAPVADYYGMGEQGISASQCPFGNYHFDFEVGIAEILPIAEDPLVGKIVCTGFFNTAMPLIRYDTQDIVHLSESDCPCGRKGLVAKGIDGRIDSYIKTPEGYLLGRLPGVFTRLDGVQEGQVVQTAIDNLLVRIVKTSAFSDETLKQLYKALRERVGNSMKIQVEYLDQIPRENNGKMRTVVSLLSKEQLYSDE